MISHAFSFFADGINYRLLVTSKLCLEFWANGWRQVPVSALADLLDRVAELGNMDPAYHTVLFRRQGMRIQVTHSRWMRFWRQPPRVDIQVLDLEAPDPWVEVDPEDPTRDLPVTVEDSVLLYRSPYPAGLWGIWAVLKQQGYLPQPWKGNSQEADFLEAEPDHNPEDDN